jgi:hypothetical protein
LKATGIGKKNLQKSRVDASAASGGRDAGGSFLRTHAPVSREILDFAYSNARITAAKSSSPWTGGRGLRKQRLHQRSQAQLHAQGARLREAVADVLEHVLELEERG